ncbi:MAG: macro domain-containing protein [Bacilli bacterium]|nr:macro domain-containing protein [Bacilli bacterium]
MKKLKIVCGDIIDHLSGNDLIINSTNKHMKYGSGVCGVIYNFAGKNLLEEYCLRSYNKNMETNEIRITPGFNLKIDILHIYAPKKHESKNPLNDLLKSYEKIFTVAKDNKYNNIVSVSIGTGVHGYKHKEIVKKVIQKINRLVIKYNINFTLVLPRHNIYELYLEEYKKDKIL